jgi:hypothetical protein
VVKHYLIRKEVRPISGHLELQDRVIFGLFSRFSDLKAMVAFNNIELSRMPMTLPSGEDFRLQVSTVVPQVIYVLRLGFIGRYSLPCFSSVCPSKP